MHHGKGQQAHIVYVCLAYPYIVVLGLNTAPPAPASVPCKKKKKKKDWPLRAPGD